MKYSSSHCKSYLRRDRYWFGNKKIKTILDWVSVFHTTQMLHEHMVICCVKFLATCYHLMPGEAYLDVIWYHGSIDIGFVAVCLALTCLICVYLQLRVPMEGLEEWLDALYTAGIPCAVTSCLDRINLLAALQRMGLKKYFQVRYLHHDFLVSSLFVWAKTLGSIGVSPYMIAGYCVRGGWNGVYSS